MKIQKLHEWRVTPAEAVRLQTELRQKIRMEDTLSPLSGIRYLCGADLAVDAARGRVFGGAIVYSFPELKEVERVSAEDALDFPYVPGLLSFREAPVLLKAFARLKHEPDVFILDGHGIAHPRGMGIASHIGLILGKPSIGCAKSLLFGKFKEPSPANGSESFLLSPSGDTLGVVLRTRERVRPVFVSPGHHISIKTSIEVIRRCCDGYRIPKPTREADRWVGQIKRN